MKRIFGLSLLLAAVLAGCGGSPLAPAMKQGLGESGVATAQDSGSKVQIFSAFKRVSRPNAMRLVLMYRVRRDGQAAVMRQLIVDTTTTEDRSAYRSGYRPTDLVLNGFDTLQDQKTLRMLVDELGALNYHTVDADQQRVVELARQILQDLLR